MPFLRIEALYEVVEVGALEGVFFEGEMLVGAQVVNPEFFGPRFFGGWFAVEEEDIRFHALRVENPSGQSQQRVDIGLFEQFAANGFPCPAFE